MFDKIQKDMELESEKMTSIPIVKTTPQKLETPQTTDRYRQTDPLKFAEPSNSINGLDLVASLQKMKKEEQELLEQKQRLVATEQNLQGKLFKEVEKKKTAINNVKTEILDRVNRCKELSRALEELNK
jgi:quinolinate synthase